MHTNKVKYLLILMAVVLTVGQMPLSAQVTGTSLACQTLSTIPSFLRAEGETEMVGDILLNCSGGVPTPAGNPIPQANITIFLNTNITSRILSNGGSEALLMIDEPGLPPNLFQQVCGSINGCSVAGTGGASEPFDGTSAARPNIFQGVVTGNTVTFYGVPVDPPGAGNRRAFRITNIRANATAIPVSNLAQVVAQISANPPAALSIDRDVVPVGNVTSGLTFGSGVLLIPACTGINDTNRSTVVTYTENFINAFKTRTTAGPTVVAPPPVAAERPGPGAPDVRPETFVPAPQSLPGVFAYNVESGFTLTGLPGAGLADSGTRLRSAFRNIPPGVDVYVSVSSIGASAKSMAVMVPSETGTYFAVAPTTNMLGVDVVKLPVVNGTATAIWEVTASDPYSIDTFSFEVIVASATSAAPSATAAPMTVNGTLAPAPPAFSVTDGVKAQPSSFPVPRFADTSTASNILSVSTCVTDILFPFITNMSGFDTGLSISSTSQDPFGTPTQTGPCILSFYGTNAPAAITTQTIAPGATYTALASMLSPNFQGYMIAVCNFQLAHGFAFISDLGARNLAMGYLGVVIQNPRVLQNTVASENGFH